MGRLAALLLVTTFAVGCASAPLRHSAPPPSWIDRPPSQAGALFAVGISEPTFYPGDAIATAIDKARGQLALNVQSKVTAVTLVQDRSGRSPSVENATMVEEITHEQTEAVIEQSEVVATWQDADGSYSGRKGTSYALVKIDLARLRSSSP